MTETENETIRLINKHLRDGMCHPEIRVSIILQIHQRPEGGATEAELEEIQRQLEENKAKLAAANAPPAS